MRGINVSVRLIENRAGPSEHLKAMRLQYRVSEILARLGIVHRFVEAGTQLTVNADRASGCPTRRPHRENQPSEGHAEQQTDNAVSGILRQ